MKVLKYGRPNFFDFNSRGCRAKNETVDTEKVTVVLLVLEFSESVTRK